MAQTVAVENPPTPYPTRSPPPPPGKSLLVNIADLRCFIRPSDRHKNRFRSPHRRGGGAGGQPVRSIPGPQTRLLCHSFPQAPQWSNAVRDSAGAAAALDCRLNPERLLALPLLSADLRLTTFHRRQ